MLNLSPLWISLKTAAIATIITFGLGIVAARWMLTYQGRGKAWLDGVLTLPLVLPPTVIGFGLLLLFGKQGPLGQMLHLLGITVIFSWSATVIAATVVAFPLMYRTTLGAFQQVNPQWLQAARTLGASERRIFWQVLLPLAWPGVLAGTVLAFARALGEFGATLMLAGNIPGQTQTISTAIFFAVERGDIAQALIWVLLVTVIALIGVVSLNQSWRSHPKSSERESAQSGTWSLLIWRITHQWWLKLPHRSRIEYQSDESRLPSLSVGIEKPLAEFVLDLILQVGSQPLGLLGASGSGKSMTLRCIAGLETPTQGSIILNGRVLFDAQKGVNLPSQQRRVGLLFQNYALFPHMTVAENITFGLQQFPRSEQQRRLSEQIVAMQLQGLENCYPQHLSGGQQQRVALARALIVDPDMLLLDEPFSALDTHLRHQLERQLRDTLATYKGVTLFVTHNIEEAYRVCADLVVLEKGQVMAAGPKAEVLARPATVTAAQITGCKNISRAIATGAHTVEALDWHCRLTVSELVTPDLAFVGMRAYQLRFTPDLQQVNTFRCWLAQASETPHRITLYLKLHTPPQNSQDYHLQAEVLQEKWQQLQERDGPWYVQLEPSRLMVLLP